MARRVAVAARDSWRVSRSIPPAQPPTKSALESHDGRIGTPEDGMRTAEYVAVGSHVSVVNGSSAAHSIERGSARAS
jgi:hypothetical protein